MNGGQTKSDHVHFDHTGEKSRGGGGVTTRGAIAKALAAFVDVRISAVTHPTVIHHGGSIGHAGAIQATRTVPTTNITGIQHG